MEQSTSDGFAGGIRNRSDADHPWVPSMLRIACLPSIALIACCLPSLALGQGYSPKFPTPIAPAPDRPNPLAHILVDVVQTMHVRKLLNDDEILKQYNLGVRVEKRVAILWGPVASPEIAKRAEQRIRRMIEISKVRDETVVMVDDPQRSPDFSNPRAAQPPATPMKGEPKTRPVGGTARLTSNPAAAPTPVLTGIEPSEEGTSNLPALPAINVPR